MSDNRKKKNNERSREQYEEIYADSRNDNSLSSTVKGIIAIMITLLVVVIVIMVFAKSLFINDNTAPVKTGRITSTEYIPPVTTTTEEVTEAQTTSKTTTHKDPYENEDLGDGSDIKCISAVYLHPKPTSSSENLLTIPSGAVCKFYRNENGWYYVEYNGTKGYAWQTFFEAPPFDAE